MTHKFSVSSCYPLSVHYRNPINFNNELLENAGVALERLRTSYQNLKHRLEVSANLVDNDQAWLEKISQHVEKFEKEMDDDFNTADGITVLFDLAKQGNVYLREENTSAKVIKSFLNTFEELFSVLGLKINQDELLDDEVDQLIEQRLEARKNRDFALADQIRDKLKEMNIILEDTRQGTRWKRG